MVILNYKEDVTNFQLNYDFNTSKFETNAINGFMTINEIYNKVKLQIKVEPYGFFHLQIITSIFSIWNQ